MPKFLEVSDTAAARAALNIRNGISIADLRDWDLIARGQWNTSNGCVYTRASNTIVNNEIPFTADDVGKVVVINADMTAEEIADTSPEGTRGGGGRRWMSEIVDVDGTGRAELNATAPSGVTVSGGRVQWGFDITGTINGALQELASDYAIPREAYLCGRYRLKQLVVPMMTTLRGAGYGYNATANSPANDRLVSTQLRQLPGSQKDFVIFDNPVAGEDSNWAGGFALTDMILCGPETNVIGNIPTVGNGVAFRSPSGTGLISNEGIELRKLWVAMFPESGFLLPAGAVPLYLTDINSEGNGKYGVEYGAAGSTPVTQLLHLLNYSCGGNNLGGARFKNVAGSDGVIMITGMKSECGKRYAPAGYPNYQYEALIFEDCQNTPVIINGAYHLRGWPDNGTKGAGPVIVIRQTTGGSLVRPRIVFNGVKNRLLGGEDPAETVNTVTLRDETVGVDIPRNVISGRYPDGSIAISSGGTSVLNNVAIDVNPADAAFSPNPLLINDMAYAIARGGSVAVTKNGSAATLVTDYNNPENAFAPDLSYMRLIPTSTSDVFTVEVTLPSTVNTAYGVTMGIYSHVGTHAKNVTIEAYWGAAWRAVTAVTKENTGFVWKTYNDAGVGPITKIRYTLTDFADASVPCRINSLWSANYTSQVIGASFLPRAGGSLYGTTATPPTISASGGDADVDLVLESKGNGLVKASRASLTGPRIVDEIKDTNGNTMFKFSAQTNAVNYLQCYNGAAGGTPTFMALGTDTDISIQLWPKGSNGKVTIYGPSDGTATIQANGPGSDSSLDLTTRGTGSVTINGLPAGYKVAVPASATATGKPGQWAADDSYLYSYTGDGSTHKWRRVAHASW